MSLIKFNKENFPWTENMGDFFNSGLFVNDEFFNLEKSLPAMNVKELKNDFEIELSAPGFEKKDFDITIDRDLLEVAAKKEVEAVKEDENYTRKEFNYNSFRRRIQLPKNVDSNKKIKATYQNGILKLLLHKKEALEEKPKRHIEVG